MNNVSLIGRLTKEPELRQTPSGASVVNFTLAVDRRFKSEGQPTADFINVVAWNKTAEFVDKYFAKGMRVGVTGRIQTRNWEDNEGKRHFATEIVGESMDFADGKRDDVGGSRQDNSFDISDDIPF